MGWNKTTPLFVISSNLLHPIPAEYHLRVGWPTATKCGMGLRRRQFHLQFRRSLKTSFKLSIFLVCNETRYLFMMKDYLGWRRRNMGWAGKSDSLTHSFVNHRNDWKINWGGLCFQLFGVVWRVTFAIIWVVSCFLLFLSPPIVTFHVSV